MIFFQFFPTGGQSPNDADDAGRGGQHHRHHWDSVSPLETLRRLSNPSSLVVGGTGARPVAAAQQAIYGSSPRRPPEGACCAARFRGCARCGQRLQQQDQT